MCLQQNCFPPSELQRSNLFGHVAKDPLLRQLALHTWSLARFVEIQDSSGLVLSEMEAVESSNLLFQYLRTAQSLAEHFWSRKQLLFKLRPKHHVLWHQAWQVKLFKLNQNIHTCWGDESFLGRLKKVGRLCHGKTMASSRVFERYILGFAVHLQDMEI